MTPDEQNTADEAVEVDVEIVEPEVEETEEAGEPSTEDRIAQLEAALAEAKDQALRRQADFNNFRKRMQREIEDIRVVGRASAIEQFLPVVDNFDMAMVAIDQAADLETLKTGMNMIHAELQRCLDGLGVERLDPTGQPFDPNEHDAIKTEPSSDCDEGTVIQLYKAGYRLGDRLLRAATVVVSSGAEEA
jgi:molecular chaperone GrpE